MIHDSTFKRTARIHRLALVLGWAALTASCGSGGGGGSGTENPTDVPADNAASGLLLAVEEFRPAVHSVTNIGQTFHAGISLAQAQRAEGTAFLWSLDGAPLSETSEALELDSSGLAVGTHCLELTVSSGGSSSAFYWSLQVSGGSIKNRAPFLLQALPAGSPRVARGEKLRFAAVAGDVDAVDSIRYSWSIDGKTQDLDDAVLDVDTSRLSAGTHAVAVVVSDGNEHADAAATRHSWTLSVEESSAPFIAGAWPAGAPRMHPRGRLLLEVAAAGTGGAQPSFRWKVDGVLQPTSEAWFDFNPSAAETGVLSGVHQVTCSLDLGDDLDSVSGSQVSWNITLDPPEMFLSPADPAEGNRLPVVAAIYPVDSSGLPQADSTTFRLDAMDGDGDVLTYRWLVDGAVVEGAGPAYTFSPDPEMGQLNSTVEVLSSDGRSSDGGSDAPSWYSLGKWSLAAVPVERTPLTLSSGALILDNGQSGTTARGTWLESSATRPYGASSLYSKRSGDTYQYSLKVPAAGSYDVLLWWTAWPNRSSAVPVTIAHGDGSTKVTVNQLAAGGQWNLLGTFPFNSSARITITAVAGGYTTCADAVCLSPHAGSPTDTSTLAPAPAGSEFTIDDGTAGTSSAGYWLVSSAKNPYGGRSLYTASTGSYAFFRPLSAPGAYDVYVWWTSVSTRDSRVPYEIPHATGTATVTRDQRTGGGQWQCLGRYEFTTEARVTVKGRGTGTVCADAARFVPAAAPNTDPTDPDSPLPEVIIDDGTAGTSSTGYWPASTGKTAYGGRSLYNASTGTYSFAWELPVPATYDVYAWWTSVHTRDSAAPYDITHAQGTSTVTKDQRTGGGLWQLLGRYAFAAKATVTIRGRGAGTVCADAVRFVWAPTLPPEPDSGPDPEPDPEPEPEPTLAPEIAVNPLSLAFGTVAVGESKTLSFTVSNSGTASLQVSSIALGSGTGTEFAILSGGGSAQLSPGQSTSITVRYAPSAGGSDQGSVVVLSSDADESRVVVSLSGSGTVPSDPTGQSVTLAWDAPTTNADGTPLTDLKGYKVYWGTSSGNYSSSADVQGSTQYTTPVLAPGPYYFTVTAYDFAGNESSRAGEISTVIP